ncbi:MULTISPECIES: response regulator [unclassified Clostridium]|uniref:response regulator transcription factor n=1 Tax=Clostridium TaxID=1485 RepID=UPI0028931D15|nr:MULTISPECIES: response regulator [unclassified Clostridium]MDU2290750.1 response regulator [Clostridium celatum]
MYKIVIIDDEPIIVEGLARTMPWDNWKCLVAGVAYDGVEGQKLIRNVRPNLIITDISMPGMNGLAMIAGLKAEFPDMEISILTGFREFEYAQKAIKLGVTRLILKPSTLTEIEEAVKTMVLNLKNKNIRTESEETELNSANSFIVKNALKYIQENYTRKITLSEVAEKTYVSQWYLSKLLNKHTGKSFSDILNQIRINVAKDLLKNPSMRIGNIAEEVGFIDIGHFQEYLKNLRGVLRMSIEIN